MVSPSNRRRAVRYCVEEGVGPTATACRALGLARSTFYRGGNLSLESRRMRQEIMSLSEQHPRYGYNQNRPHSSLGYQTPEEFAARCLVPVGASPLPTPDSRANNIKQPAELYF